MRIMDERGGNEANKYKQANEENSKEENQLVVYKMSQDDDCTETRRNFKEELGINRKKRITKVR